MGIDLIDQGPALAEASVMAAENRLGLLLPNDYRQFLFLHNAPEVHGADLHLQSVAGEEVVTTVDFFLGLGVPNGVDLEYHVSRFRARVPGDVIPIARDGTGDLFLTPIDGRSGPILFWDHELDDGTLSETGLTVVSRDLAALFRKLEGSPDES